MKITVIDILPTSENHHEIIFDTEVGQGEAIFTNNSFNAKVGFPKIGENYSVEFTVNALFENSFQSITNEKYNIYHQDNHVFLTGKIEEIDDDLLFFRLNTDCLIMIDFEKPLDLAIGSFVSLKAKTSDFIVYFH